MAGKLDASGTKWYNYAGYRVISEENQSSATSDGSFLALYVHDPGKVVGSILARGFMFGNFSLAQYYQDQIGSTRMIRNHNNQLNNLYEYDPYGNVITTYGSESFNYYRFAGAELDKDSSNFYWFRPRYHSPALQRYMQHGSPHSFSENNPANTGDNGSGAGSESDGYKGRFGPRCSAPGYKYLGVLEAAADHACASRVEQITDEALKQCILGRCHTQHQTIGCGSTCLCQTRSNDPNRYVEGFGPKGQWFIIICDAGVSGRYFDKDGLADVIIHELAHNCGWEHGQDKGVPGDSGATVRSGS